MINGGGVFVGDRSTIFLDASRSFDPDDTLTPFAYSWACTPLFQRTSTNGNGTGAGGSGCTVPSGAQAALGASPSQALRLLGAEGDGNRYNITLTVSKGNLTAATSTIVTFLTGSGPVVRISGLLAAKARALPQPGAPHGPHTLTTLPTTLSAYAPATLRSLGLRCCTIQQA